MSAPQSRLRQLPSVDECLSHPAVAALLSEYPRSSVVESVRVVLEACRQRVLGGADEAPELDAIARDVAAAVAARERRTLRRAINATGVILHTGLGRAPLGEAARQAVADAAGYCVLETEADTGRRGERAAHIEPLLRELTGAEASFAVNNNAAAVLLAMKALAEGREVIISRGQLVEIGGAFRIPEVIAQAGCRLVEVGTTNRTHLKDYERAISERTACVLWCHQSNFRVVGFSAEVPVADLAALAHGRGLPCVADLGSGAFLDLGPLGIGDEPLVRDIVAAGADLVTASGDKLLGGPQAGLLVGRADLVRQCRRHPLARAVRIDKLCLAALEATLRAYRDDATARQVPVMAMILRPVEEIEEAARRAAEALRAPLAAIAEVSVAATTAEIGGGSLPAQQLPSWAVALTPLDAGPEGADPERRVTSEVEGSRGADALAARLRALDPAVFGRIEGGRVLLDLRTVGGSEEELTATVGRLPHATGSRFEL